MYLVQNQFQPSQCVPRVRFIGLIIGVTGLTLAIISFIVAYIASIL